MSGAMQATDTEPYPFETRDDFRLWAQALLACGRVQLVPRRELAGADWARVTLDGRAVYLVAEDAGDEFAWARDWLRSAYSH
jgi:hypothetical protein